MRSFIHKYSHYLLSWLSAVIRWGAGPSPRPEAAKARGFLDERSGVVVVLVALAMPVLLGLTAMAVDVSQWSGRKNSIQAAADNSVLSAVMSAAHAGATLAQVRNQAYAVAAATGFTNGSNSVTVTVNNPPLSGNYTSNNSAYEVIITQPQTSYFWNAAAKMLGSVVAAPTISGRAVALGAGKPACLIALDPSASPNVSGIIGAGSGGLNASGSGTISLTNCDIFVNAKNSSSIDVTGGGNITANYVTTSGNYVGSVTATVGGTPTTNAAATADPYASTRSIPSWSSCSSQTTWSGTISNPTGTLAFCSNINTTGSTTLNPGVYILNGSLTSTYPITGTGVTIILSSNTPSSDNGVFDFKSGANVTLSAPTTGATAGIALWADAKLPHEADQFYAGSNANIIGAVYLPSHLINFSGSATGGSTCFQLSAARPRSKSRLSFRPCF